MWCTTQKIQASICNINPCIIHSLYSCQCYLSKQIWNNKPRLISKWKQEREFVTPIPILIPLTTNNAVPHTIKGKSRTYPPRHKINANNSKTHHKINLNVFPTARNTGNQTGFRLKRKGYPLPNILSNCSW